MRGVGLAPLRHQLEHDGRAAHRCQEAPEHPRVERQAEGDGRQRRHQDRGADLEEAVADDRAEGSELAQGKLDPDGEQQQHNAHLGEDLHTGHVIHNVQPVRAQQRTRDEEADDGGEPEPVEPIHDHDRSAEEHDQVAEEMQFSHEGRP